MAYTTINKPTDYFNTNLWTGNGYDNRTITGVGFQSDFTWIKSRTNTDYHMITDSVRGGNKQIIPNDTNPEDSDTNKIKSFTSDGFVIGTGTVVNRSGATFVSWNLKANGAGSANSAGATASTVSVNTTAGFSIVKWTNSTSNATTIGHGLGVAPQVMLTKTTSSAGHNWHVYHHKLDTTPQGDYLILNNTSGKSTATNIWNDTAPTSTVFSTGNNGALVNNTLIAYCFAEKKGYSKFGSYTGNGNVDGTFVYTGFKPAFVMVKKTDNTGGWSMFDNKRFGYNPKNHRVLANVTDTEENDDKLDFLSNGFKWRVSQSTQNASGGSYIYMAFAETPLVGSNGVTAKAR